MSPTPIGRSRGHRQGGVGDSDLEAVLSLLMRKHLMVCVAPSFQKLLHKSETNEKHSESGKQDRLFCFIRH
ncbi:MAG: hypothetical protein K2H92_06690 [Bacteroidaceae bacterium]|nr:hypothetical protein [Bacteroidaceae bacterium]